MFKMIFKRIYRVQVFISRVKKLSSKLYNTFNLEDKQGNIATEINHDYAFSVILV